MLSFKPTFSLSSFTFTERLFSSYSLSAIRVVSSAYLRLLIFCQGPASAGSRGTLRMNGVGEKKREETRETSLDRAKSCEGEREKERERERMTRRGCLQSLANLYFFTVALYSKLVHF